MKLVLVTVALLALSSATALACPKYLSSFQSPSFVESAALSSSRAPANTLCELYDQHHASRVSLNELHGSVGDVAYRTRAIYGPRFIHSTNFFGSPIAASVKYNPWLIYQPAPDTWQQWENAQALIQHKISKNLSGASSGQNSQPELLSKELLLQIHDVALRGLPKETHKFRRHAEQGLLWRQSHAQPKGKMNEIFYPLDPNGKVIPGVSKPMTKWTVTKCVEEMVPAQKQCADQMKVDSIIKEQELSFFEFFDGRLTQLQCGYVTYLDHNEIEKQLDLLIQDINAQLKDFYSSDPKKKAGVDPVRLAARAQRWFIGIHPFLDGNGRTSRLLMDYILMSLGLPAPILHEMDLDMVKTEDDWAIEIAHGHQRALDLEKECIQRLSDNPKDPFCALTSFNPPKGVQAKSK